MSEWTSEKPTKAGPYAYEHLHGIYCGAVSATNEGLYFNGYRPGDLKYGSGLQGPVSVFGGRWLALGVPPPPKRMTPGEVVGERMKSAGWMIPAADVGRFNAAVTAAIEAAKRGELDIGGDK